MKGSVGIIEYPHGLMRHKIEHSIWKYGYKDRMLMFSL
jgi:hypothetical protein